MAGPYVLMAAVMSCEPLNGNHSSRRLTEVWLTTRVVIVAALATPRVLAAKELGDEPLLVSRTARPLSAPHPKVTPWIVLYMTHVFVVSNIESVPDNWNLSSTHIIADVVGISGAVCE